MSKIPKFRLFAGPNGSGKTTLINTLVMILALGFLSMRIYWNMNWLKKDFWTLKKSLENQYLNSLIGMSFLLITVKKTVGPSISIPLH
ncbi:hypothetical protein JYB64_09090 [Algoriphagus aestuarii]|nr:hypothetical protein [Algoriphagus aestuarii]